MRSSELEKFSEKVHVIQAFSNLSKKIQNKNILTA